MTAFKRMLEEQTRDLIQAQAEHLANHASVLAQHTRALVEQMQERSHRTDSSFARVGGLLERSANVREERPDVVNECCVAVKEELCDALGDCRPQPEGTTSNVAECRGMVGQLRTAGDGNVGDPTDPSLSTPIGYPLPCPPPFSQNTSPVSDDGDHRVVPSDSSDRSTPASGAGRRAREPKTYFEKVPLVALSSVTYKTAAVGTKRRLKVVREELSDVAGLSLGKACAGVGDPPTRMRRPRCWVEDIAID